VGLRIGLLPLVAVIALAAWEAPIAGAAGWSLQPSPNPPGATDSVLSSVSCRTRAMCTAVGHWTDEPYGGDDSTGRLSQRP